MRFRPNLISLSGFHFDKSGFVIVASWDFPLNFPSWGAFSLGSGVLRFRGRIEALLGGIRNKLFFRLLKYQLVFVIAKMARNLGIESQFGNESWMIWFWFERLRV